MSGDHEAEGLKTAEDLVREYRTALDADPGQAHQRDCLRVVVEKVADGKLTSRTIYTIPHASPFYDAESALYEAWKAESQMRGLETSGITRGRKNYPTDENE